MRGFLLISSILAALVGFLAFGAIDGFLLFVTAAVLFSGYAIVNALFDVLQELKSNGAKLDRLGAALATPPELDAAPAPSTAEPTETYLVQLSDGVRGTFTHAQLQALLDRGIVDQRAYILPAGAASWIRVSELSATR